MVLVMARSATRPTADAVAEDLRHAVGALVRRVRAETADEDVLAYPLRSLLRRLERDGAATTADLARAEQITPQTAGAFVAKLEEDGYVTRRDDPADARRRLVSLTAAGRKILAEARSHRRSWIARRIEQELDADEKRALVAAIPVLRKLAEG
jgi:DNA-binding MarR family transcriptional regulator